MSLNFSPSFPSISNIPSLRLAGSLLGSTFSLCSAWTPASRSAWLSLFAAVFEVAFHATSWRCRTNLLNGGTGLTSLAFLWFVVPGSKNK